MPGELSRLYNIGYTALRARQYELETLSDNLANINTTGFKEHRATFEAALGLQGQVGENVGVELGSDEPDFRQGPTQMTGQTWDLAVDGPGFFTVRLPDGQVGYTRLGTFLPNAQGRLVTEQGYLLEPAITVAAGATEVNIDARGVVTANVNGVPQLLGRVQLARFANPEGLIHQGSGVYTPSPASGPAVVAAASENGVGQIIAGALEMSNVDVPQQMISILNTQRCYSMSLRALQVTDQMSSLTNQLEA